MNIFFLSENLERCAQYHADKHVCKMLLEYAQILCSVCNLSGQDSPYKTTHSNHPCVKWALESLDNWRWLRQLEYHLNREYIYRFNKTCNHKSYDVIQQLDEPYIDSKGVTERPQCMPELLQVPGNPTLAYRIYYLTEKKKLLKWSNRTIPYWVTGGYKILFES